MPDADQPSTAGHANQQSEAQASPVNELGLRFRLRTVLWATVLVSVGCVLAKYSLFAVVYWLFLLSLTRLPRVARSLSAADVMILIAFQATFAWAVASMHTDARLGLNGAVIPLFVAFLGFVPALAIGFGPRRVSIAFVAAYVGFALWSILPQKLEWGELMRHVQEEADAIILYANEVKAETGAYPSDLNGYNYRRREIEQHIDYGKFRDGTFVLACWITDPATTYEYGSDSGWYWAAD